MDRKDGRLHLKLYITLIFCVVIAITVTSTTLYMNFQSILMKNEYRNKLDKMESEAKRIDKLSDMALNTLYQIYNDISVIKLLRYDNPRGFDENAAFIQLRYYLANVPDVDSIYIYNYKNNRIYNVSNEADLVRPWEENYFEKDAKFYDQSAVLMLESKEKYLPFIPVPRFYQVNDHYTKLIYTYMMYDTFQNSDTSNAVMLNLEASYLFQEDISETDSISLVVDKNNRIIYSTSEKYKVLEQMEDLKQIQSTGIGKSGYYITELDGARSVVIYSGADRHHWRYISIISYNKLLSQVRRLQTITVMISLLIAGLGILAAHLFSKRLTVPIQAMSKDIKSLQNEKRLTENLEKNRRLVELLENGGFDKQGNQISGSGFLLQTGLETGPERNLRLLCLFMDDHRSHLEQGNMNETALYKFAAVNIINELLGENAYTYCLEISDDKSLILVNADNEMSHETVASRLGKMQQLMSEYYKVSISVIIGEKEKDTNQIFVMYEELKSAIARKIFWTEGMLVSLPEPGIKPVHEYEYPEMKEKQLVEKLLFGKAKEAGEIYDEIIRETGRYPVVIYNMAINRVIVALDNVINLLKRNGSMPSLTGFIALFNILKEEDSLEKRNAKFHELFRQIQGEMEKKKNEKHDQVIAKINRKIDSEYDDSGFSLDLLADSIGISNAYMCRIYKQYTGNTIIDILVEKRMEKARELLKNTDLPVNEVAERVGYNNPSYFYRVFKKSNGITPNEYRNK